MEQSQLKIFRVTLSLFTDCCDGWKIYSIDVTTHPYATGSSQCRDWKIENSFVRR